MSVVVENRDLLSLLSIPSLLNGFNHLLKSGLTPNQCIRLRLLFGGCAVFTIRKNNPDREMDLFTSKAGIVDEFSKMKGFQFIPHGWMLNVTIFSNKKPSDVTIHLKLGTSDFYNANDLLMSDSCPLLSYEQIRREFVLLKKLPDASLTFESLAVYHPTLFYSILFLEAVNGKKYDFEYWMKEASRIYALARKNFRFNNRGFMDCEFIDKNSIQNIETDYNKAESSTIVYTKTKEEEFKQEMDAMCTILNHKEIKDDKKMSDEDKLLNSFKMYCLEHMEKTGEVYDSSKWLSINADDFTNKRPPTVSDDIFSMKLIENTLVACSVLSLDNVSK